MHNILAPKYMYLSNWQYHVWTVIGGSEEKYFS